MAGMEMTGIETADMEAHDMGGMERHGTEHMSHAEATGDGIEWEDTMPEMNVMSNRSNMSWKIIDAATGTVSREISWRFRLGDRVKIRLDHTAGSDHRTHHPFHGAGRFLVLDRGGVPEPNLAWKDTVLVRAGEVVDILIDAGNPGRWVAHCHVAEHNESGMMFSFDVVQGAEPSGGGAVTDKTVVFVLYPGLTPLDLIGPLQVMSGLEVVEWMYGAQPRHHVVVVAENLDAVPTDTPVRVAATSTLDEVPEPDVILVPGGGAPTLRQLANPVLLDYLRKADRSAEWSSLSALAPCYSPEPACCKDARPPPTGSRQADQRRPRPGGAARHRVRPSPAAWRH